LSAVYLLNLQTGERKRVTGFAQNCYGSWSPDGSSLALAFGDQRSVDIYVASLDGKHTRRITDSQAIDIKPVWSPNGKRIAFISVVPESQGGTESAYSIDADGTNQKRIGDLNAYEVSWSTDGKSLLLQSAEGLFLAYPDENRTVRLTSGVVQPRDAVFTPDGRGVMFRSNHEGDWYLYAVDLNGGSLRKISGRLSASTFCLSPLKG
jgi:TolB protein